MKTVRIFGVALVSVFMVGYGVVVAEANTSHDHSGHADMEKMADPAMIAHVAVDSATQHQIDRLVGAYLAVSDQLAHDRLDSLAGPFEQMGLAAQLLTKNKAEHVAMHATKISSSVPGEFKDLKKVRASFAVLSGAVIALVEKTPPSHMAGHEVNKAYCPMKSAAWLQKGTDVLNPYYGSEMLSCGTIKNAIETVQVH